MSDNSEATAFLEFWIEGVLITVVSTLGILENMIYILKVPYKQFSINQTLDSLIKWLAAIDSVFLVIIALLINILTATYC